jgi:hypothetical protein
MTPPKVIALEERFTSSKLRALRGEKDTPVQHKLNDLGELRIREMDEAGIDLQGISENNSVTQNPDAEMAAKLVPATMCGRALIFGANARKATDAVMTF